MQGLTRFEQAADAHSPAAAIARAVEAVGQVWSLSYDPRSAVGDVAAGSSSHIVGPDVDRIVRRRL